MDLILPLSFPNKDALAGDLRGNSPRRRTIASAADQALAQPKAQRDQECSRRSSRPCRHS